MSRRDFFSRRSKGSRVSEDGAAAAAESDATRTDRHPKSGGSGPLTSIQLKHQQLCDDAMPSIAVLLCHSPITIADLSHNEISPAGCRDLVTPLFFTEGCPTLTTLQLAHNRLADEGATILSKLIASHPNLTEVDLSGNDIGCVGAQSLAKSLPSSALTSLRLDSNPLAGGGIAIAISLQTYPRSSLSELSLCECLVDDAVGEHLLLALAHNTNLRRIDLKENHECSSQLLEQIATTLARRDSEEAIVRTILRSFTPEPDRAIDALRRETLAQPLADYCMELTKLLLGYYDELDVAVQHRLCELDPLSSTGGGEFDGAAALALEEQDEFIPVRPNKGSKASDRRAKHTPHEFSASTASLPYSSASSSSRTVSLSSATSVASASSTMRDSSSSFLYADSLDTSFCSSLDLPTKVRLYVHLQCFPLIVARLIDGLHAFRHAIKQPPSNSSTATTSPAHSHTNSAANAIVAPSPISTPTSPHSRRLLIDPFVDPITLWDAYKGLELLIGVLLLRADKSMAASRARAYVLAEVARLRRTPHLYRGGTQPPQQPSTSSGHTFIDHTNPNRSLPSTPVRKRGGGSTNGSHSPPSSSRLHHNSVSVPTTPQRTVSTARAAYAPNTGASSISIGKYPIDTTFFDGDILDQLNDSFLILEGLSTAIRTSIIAQVDSIHQLVREDDLEILDHIFRILANEEDGLRHGRMQLMDELVTARKWTKIPQLIDHNAQRHTQRDTFGRAVYRALEQTIAHRFDQLEVDEDEPDAAQVGDITMQVEEMTCTEAEQVTGRTQPTGTVHHNGPIHGSTASSGRSVALVSSSSVASRPVGPLLSILRELVSDLRSLKHKIGPLVARTQREAKARHRERVESAEAKRMGGGGGCVRPASNGITLTANQHDSSHSRSLSDQLDTFDLFSFAFERYHQRFMHCLVSPRFRAASLSLTDILACVEFIHSYERFLRGLFPRHHQAATNAATTSNNSNDTCDGSRRPSLSGSVDPLSVTGAVSSSIGVCWTDFEPELNVYIDDYMSEWVARQFDKARPWWANIFAAEIATPPESTSDFGDGDDDHAAQGQRQYYCTNAPQDLFSRLNSYVDLVVDDHPLTGRALHRVGGMVIDMVRFFLTTQHVQWIAQLKEECCEFRPIEVRSSIEKEKEYQQAIHAHAGEEEEAHQSATMIPRMSHMSKSITTKLVNAIPIRIGGEKKSEQDKTQRRKRDKSNERTQKESASSSSLTDDVAGDSAPSSSSSSPSATFVPRPFSSLRPALIHLLAQVNNVSLYRFHSDRLSDVLLDQLETEVDQQEEEVDAADAAADADGLYHNTQVGDDDDTCTSRLYLRDLESCFDELEERFTDYTVECIAVLADICLNRVQCILTGWYTDSNLKQVYGRSCADVVASPTLASSLLSTVSECLTFLVPRIRKPLEATILIKYVLAGMCALYVACMVTAANKKIAACTPQRRLAMTIEQIRYDKMRIRTFFADQPAHTDDDDNREDGEGESEGDDPSNVDDSVSTGLGDSSIVGDPCIRSLVSLKDVDHALEVLDTFATLLTADDDFIQVHHAHLATRFPFDHTGVGGSSSSRRCGLNCLLLLQGALQYRCDIRSQRRVSIIHEFINFITEQQSEKEEERRKGKRTQVPHTPNETPKKNKKKSKKMKKDGDCVIS